jgi:hypothetical protein
MAPDLADHAVHLHEYGFAPIALHRPVLNVAGRVIACNCWKGAQCPVKNWGKHPVNDGWQHKTHLFTDPDEIRAEFGQRHQPNQLNIGCVTGPASGLLIIDIDVGDGKPGEEELRKLEGQLGALPATPTVVTGSGGLHLYFEYPDATVIQNSASSVAAGVDVRGKNGQGVLPPSLHKSGNFYRWKTGCEPWQVGIADLPPTWRDLLAAAPRKRFRPPAGGHRAITTHRPNKTAYPSLTIDQAKLLLATMLEHPLVGWASAFSNDVSREVWRGIATNLAIPVIEHPELEDIARRAFHALSRDYENYSENETDQTFDGALDSAASCGPITLGHMQDHGAPTEACESLGGSSLVHSARRTLLRESPTCRTSTASSPN